MHTASDLAQIDAAFLAKTAKIGSISNPMDVMWNVFHNQINHAVGKHVDKEPHKKSKKKTKNAPGNPSVLTALSAPIYDLRSSSLK